jgi:drug/metabolite transporter (DMT)-like permease
MKDWLKYSFGLVFVYTLWTLIFEYIVKKHSDCFCSILFVYIFAGILATFVLLSHIKKDCKLYKKITDIKTMPIFILILIVIISVCVIISNKLWVNALKYSNSGYIGSISNLYIVFVTILSAYLFKTKVSMINGAGIGAMLFGAYLLSK